MTSKLVLISHLLCPYVQRAAIMLDEKGMDYERIDIDLANKPDWFLRLSPLGKTPVLLVGDVPIFESAVICEYLDEVSTPHLHPADPLQRAMHRSWMEFGSSILSGIAGFYAAPDELALEGRASDIRRQFVHLESVLDAGPYFGGECFSMVDVVFGPIFRYFDVFDGIPGLGFFDSTPKVRAWRGHLRNRTSIRNAVRAAYPDLLRTFLKKRGTAISRRMDTEAESEISAMNT